MHPVFFSLWKFTIFSYGFFVALAFIVSILYLHSIVKLKKQIISQDELCSLILYMVVFGIIGSRFFFVIINLHEFLLYPLNIFKLWQGGLVYYGGFISVILFLVIYAKNKNLQVFKLADLFAPALALGHAIGRIGCYFSGCCYGKESSLPWAVVFNDTNSAAVIGVHLHPTQIYEALGNFLLFIFLNFYCKKINKTGLIFAAYLILYSVLRFTVEVFRGDYRGIQCFGLSISQIISMCLFIIGVFIICKKK
jgi:phosphatidylglycerol:prolipoprotein diacylglycerol transferase